MNQINAVMYDANLFKMACNLFGEDIVESAYVSESQYMDIPRMKKLLVGKTFKTVKPEINNGCMNIVIEFKNGKTVEITNSEWGSIGSFDLTTSTKL